MRTLKGIKNCLDLVMFVNKNCKEMGMNTHSIKSIKESIELFITVWKC